jgi:hypothetical protein
MITPPLVHSAELFELALPQSALVILASCQQNAIETLSRLSKLTYGQFARARIKGAVC